MTQLRFCDLSLLNEDGYQIALKLAEIGGIKSEIEDDINKVKGELKAGGPRSSNPPRWRRSASGRLEAPRLGRASCVAEYHLASARYSPLIVWTR